MTPTSIPTAPPPPTDQQAYGLGNLKMVQGFTRASYEAAFGVQAPNFNPALSPKPWFDSSAVAGTPSVYQTVALDKSDKPAYVSFTLPGEQAASVNLAGNRHYDKYVPAPTGTTQFGFTGAQIPVDPANLVTPTQAASIASVLGGTVQEFESARAPLSYPPNEDRRWFLIDFGNNVLLQAGYLVAQMYGNGVGAPGHWVNTPGDPHWVSDFVPPAPVNNLLPEVSYPMRQLNADEHFIQTGLGGSVIQVVRGLLPVEKQAQGGGGFTDTDRKKLDALWRAQGNPS